MFGKSRIILPATQKKTIKSNHSKVMLTVMTGLW